MGSMRLFRTMSAALIVIILVTAALAACSSPGATPAGAYKWPAGITIGTPGVTSAAYAAMAAWTSEMEKASGMKVRLSPEDNTSLQNRWLGQGQIDLQDQNETTTADIISANPNRPEYQVRDGGPYQIRRVAMRQPTYFSYFAAGDSGIKTFKDIKKGTRISLFTNSPDWVGALLAMLQYTDKDVQLVPFAAYASSVQAVTQGKTDVAVVAPSAATAFEAESGPRGAVWLSLPTEKEDPEAVKRFRSVWSVPIGPITSGVKSAIGKNCVVLFGGLWGTTAMADDLAYNIVKWQAENYNLFKDKTSETPGISLENLRWYLDQTMLPTHNGTIKYMKDRGMWKPADDDRQKYNEWRLGQYIAAYKAAIADADKQGIAVAPENAKWRDLWKDYVTTKYKLQPFVIMGDAEIKAGLANIK